MMLGATHIYLHAQSFKLPPSPAGVLFWACNWGSQLSRSLRIARHAGRMNEPTDLSWVRPGAKCICIDDSVEPVRLPGLPAFTPRGVMPVKGRSYTVQFVEFHK